MNVHDLGVIESHLLEISRHLKSIDHAMGLLWATVLVQIGFLGLIAWLLYKVTRAAGISG